MDPLANTSESWVFKKDGEDYLKLCVDVTLYFVGSLSDHADGILDFYEQALTLAKPEVSQYETGTMSKPKPINADTFNILPMWVSNAKSQQDMMQLRLDNSTGPDSAADWAIQFAYFEYDNAGVIRFVLPASFVEGSSEPLATLARRLPRKLKFSSGLGGYSLNWNKIGELAYEAKKDVYIISQRYPGIDIPDLDGDLEVISQGIKCVNWLTFLGSEYVEKLGGIDKLKGSLNHEIVCDRIGNGAVIQAGPRPETGDVNRRLTLPLYQQVGRLVAPLRFQQHMAFIPSLEDADEATLRWLARFDS
jgi:hypothetical protein